MKITNTQLKELVKTVVSEETEYQTFFKKALEKTGKSIPSMSDEEKKEFFNKIDAAWKAKGEKNEELTGNQHKLDVDGDGEIEASDLAALRAGKKKDESVNENKINIDKKVTNIINTSDFKKFVRYINSFYGKKGVYSSGKDVKEKDIMKALYNVFKRNNSYEWGDGDSVDREFVRDELMKMGILSDKMYEQEVNEGLSLDIAKHMSGIHKGFVKVEGDGTMVYDSPATAKKAAAYLNSKKIAASSDGKYLYIESVNEEIKVGSSVIVNNPTLKKPIKGKVKHILKSPKGLVYVLNDPNGVWDAKWVSTNESVNEARTVSKPIKVDDETMVQIAGDNKGFRELTATLNPKTGKPIQKFGYDRGNEIADSKEELIKKLQKKYGKSIKFESVNEGDFNNSIKRKLQNPDKQFKSAIEFIKALSSAGVDKSAISTNDWDGSPSTNVYITIPYGSKRNGGKTKVFKNKFGNRALKNALKFWKSSESVNEDKPPKGVNLSIIDKEIKRRGKDNMLKHFQNIKKNKLYTKVNTPKSIDYLIKYVSNFNESVNEAKGKPKFKVGQFVNYIPKLSGLSPNKKLQISKVSYKGGDELTQPGWYYQFKGTNLSSAEKNIKLAESVVNEVKSVKTYNSLDDFEKIAKIGNVFYLGKDDQFQRASNKDYFKVVGKKTDGTLVISRTTSNKKFTIGADRYDEKVHLVKESVNEGSMDWEKHFKGYNEKELKVISKLIWMNPQGIDGVIKMSNKKDFKPFIQKAAKKGLGESVNEGQLKKFDDVHIKSKNLSGMVYKISGNTVVVRTIDGLVKAKKDDVTKIYNDNVNEDLGTIALGVMGGIGLFKILKFALKKVGVAVGSRVSLPKESLHKVVEQTQQALIKNFIKGDKTLNMMEIAALSKLLKDYIDDGTIKNAKDIQNYSKRTIEAIIKKRK